MQIISRFYSKSDRVVFYLNALALSVAVFITGLWQLRVGELPAKIPFFYSLSWGENQLTSSHQFIIIPALIILVVLFNMALSWYLHPSQYPLKRILAISSLIFALLMLASSTQIIFLFL